LDLRLSILLALGRAPRAEAAAIRTLDKNFCRQQPPTLDGCQQSITDQKFDLISISVRRCEKIHYDNRRGNAKLLLTQTHAHTDKTRLAQTVDNEPRGAVASQNAKLHNRRCLQW